MKRFNNVDKLLMESLFSNTRRVVAYSDMFHLLKIIRNYRSVAQKLSPFV